DSPHECLQEPQIVLGGEHGPQHFAGLEKVAQIAQGVSSNWTFRIHGLGLAGILFVANIDSPILVKQKSVAGNPRGEHAVEHVYSSFHSIKYIVRRPNSHYVAWFLFRQKHCCVEEHFPENLWWF